MHIALNCQNHMAVNSAWNKCNGINWNRFFSLLKIHVALFLEFNLNHIFSTMAKQYFGLYFVRPIFESEIHFHGFVQCVLSALTVD